MNIHERIKALPRILDVKNTNQLGIAINYSAQSIGNISNGKTKPSFNLLESLCLTYPDLNARWLLTGEGEPLMSMINEKDLEQEEYEDLKSEIEELRAAIDDFNARLDKLE